MLLLGIGMVVGLILYLSIILVLESKKLALELIEAILEYETDMLGDPAYLMRCTLDPNHHENNMKNAVDKVRSVIDLMVEKRFVIKSLVYKFFDHYELKFISSENYVEPEIIE